MRAFALAFGLALICLPVSAAEPAPADGACAGRPRASGPCASLRAKDQADKLAPKRGGETSFVGDRRSPAGKMGEKREWESARDRIDAALGQGQCDEARKIAVDEGLHDLAAQIRRACRGRS